MKLWVRERDLLVEQTLAFVEGITGSASPLRAALAGRPASPATIAAVPSRVLDIVSQSPAPPRVAEPASAAPRQTLPDVRQAAPKIAAPAPVSERDEIRQRVAAFKARQQRFQQDRERHCDETFARALKISRNQAAL